jgi:hypothetical protein
MMSVQVTIEKVGTVVDDTTGKEGDGLVVVVNGKRFNMNWKVFRNSVAGALTMMGDQKPEPKQTIPMAAVPAAK